MRTSILNTYGWRKDLFFTGHNQNTKENTRKTGAGPIHAQKQQIASKSIQ